MKETAKLTPESLSGLLVAILTACGGSGARVSAPLPESVTKSATAPTVAQQIKIPAGGKFKASYSGTVQWASCGFMCSIATLKGTGRARFLHKSTQSETLMISCAVDECDVSGTATLTSDKDSKNSFNLELSGTSGEGSSSAWSAVSGTGKFVNVSGNGDWRITYGSGSGTYTQSLSGTLNY